ncbi:hypothetical protein LIER_09454 [Lithospermum erythrorhizon]|uniref:Senescence-associated protein SPA15, chloroplastic n=1 Tax=Lithospermum erythrorhizon TaxID=34254 RepID=A0AAV3PK22_LITER
MANSNGIIYSSVKSPQHPKIHAKIEAIELNRHQIFSLSRVKSYHKAVWRSHGKLRKPMFLCRSTETRNTKIKEHTRKNGDYSDNSSNNLADEDEQPRPHKCIPSGAGLAEAYKFAYNDAKFIDERAKNDIVLLSRGIRRLDARARQDVAILGSGFLKLDARAREDTEKIDLDVKRRAERLHHIAMILKNKAQSRLKKAADKHWSDGALEADLRRADFAAKQRAMEDSLMALEFLRNVHNRMVSKMYKLKGSPLDASISDYISLEKNGKTLDLLSGEVSNDQLTAIQDAYRDIATALSEADCIDYSDAEELEILVATLIDLDAMDSKSSVSLLAECSSSPDDNTRKALANALSSAPSMWTLGNAGMGALQRLAEDSNPAIASAASNTIAELKRQWEIEEGDSWS